MKKLVVGVIAATLALAACGGSSKNNANPAGSATTVSGGNTGTTVGGGGGSDDLSALVGNYGKAKIKITYKTSSDGDNSNITIAQDGNGKSAFSTGTSTFYTDGTTSVSCTGTGASAKCTSLGKLGAATAGLGSIFTSSFSALARVFDQLGKGDKSSETIAGRDAQCVKYKASDFLGKLSALPLFKDDSTNAGNYDANDSATICVDKDTGFLLKISSTKKGVEDDTFVATEVGEPSDSDFTPPVTPETIPNITLPSGITLPNGVTLPQP